MSTSSRAIVSLDGMWDLTVLAPDSSVGTTANVVVPGPWTTQIPGYGDSHDTVVYAREFTISPDATKRSYLRFAGVNYSATVNVNGVEVGSHTGSWTAFEFDVTEQLVDGTNRVEVTVAYPPRIGSPSELGFLEVPHGKQSWYGTTAGIWQSVTLEQRSALHLRDLSVRADAGSSTIVVNPVLSLSDESAQLRVSVLYAGTQVAFFEGAARERLDIAVPGPLHLWGIDQPNLYDVVLEVVSGGHVVDSVSRSVGFRTLDTREGKFFLNGNELEIRAVLDQDYHPGASSIPESTQALEDLFRKTRDLGFNMLRVHIKRPDPRYYELADKLGILVWTELPSWLTWTPEVAADGLALLKRFIREDQHHPSIVMWTVINESWGLDLRSSKQRAWLRSAYEDIKSVAQGSLVVDNSACLPNFHLKSDVDDYHLYRGIPESRREWDSKIAEFAARPDWSYSPYGDGDRSGDEPLMLSEFGNWGLPHALDQYEDGKEPWWFAIGADWAFGAAEGTDLLGRFERTGLKDVFGTWENLVTSVQKVQFIANRYQTSCIRSHPSISGYVVTQLSDVEWEANGLFDANRTPKQFSNRYALANGDFGVAFRPNAYSVFAGDTVSYDLTVIPSRSGKGNEANAAGTIRILVDGVVANEVEIATGTWETVQGRVTLPSKVNQYELTSQLWVEDQLVAEDGADIIVVAPQDSAAPKLSGPIFASDESVARWLADLGFEAELFVPAADSGIEGDESGLLVTAHLDAGAQRFARNGGHVLALAESEDSLADALDFLPSIRVGSRSGDGDWVPRNEWLNRIDAFAQVPGDTILGIAFEDVLGPFVFSGVPNMMRPAVQYSGIFSGWIRGQASSTAKFRWSEGMITLTSFKLRAGLASSPVAHALGRAMIVAASAK